MSIFEKTAQDEKRFQAFLEKAEKARRDLEPYAACVRLEELERVKTDFESKTGDFFRNDRKLNIGVIGQVKAGKSSFLNTLLFEGKKVLPSAATPKTATLTKIEYGEENLLQVEYYTPEEWATLERTARTDSGDSGVAAAKEIMKMVAEQGIVPADYTGKGSEEFRFASAGELMEQMNDYVGENGRYTALVKNVTICMNRPELRDISIVDTPGLNDAIASRTDRTRKFIGMCDVVFFLSRASQFMDASDMRLLTAQLPQEGVKKMVVLCSRFDDGLADTIEDADSIEEAIASTQASLTRHAARVMDGMTRPDLLKVLEPCRNPIFVSALCWNMSGKKPEDYSAQERLALGNIDCHDDVDTAMLRRIGNMGIVQEKFSEVVADRDATLSEKARGFLPSAEADLRTAVENLRKETEHTLNILRTGDRVQLATEKQDIKQQIDGIRSSVEQVFGQVLAKLDRNKLDALRDLREANQECGQLQEHVGTETKERRYRVSDSKWWNPFSWGSGHYEYTTYEEKYNYLAASDALENMRIFGTKACTSIEQIFAAALDITEIKRQLLRVIMENFDASSAQYDAAYFRLVTEQTLNTLEFPVIRLDVSREQETIASQFSGEVKNKEDQTRLQREMFSAAGRLLELVISKLESQVSAFRGELGHMKETFCQQLLENIESDFARLEQKFEHKEQEIHTYEDLLTLLHILAQK